jgi:hypothetical protein
MAVTRYGDRVLLEVVTTSGRAAAIEVRVRCQTVEIWRGNRCHGVFDREELHAWIEKPDGAEESVRGNDVTFHLDRLIDVDGRVAISMPDVSGWTLSPQMLDDLRRRL